MMNPVALGDMASLNGVSPFVAGYVAVPSFDPNWTITLVPPGYGSPESGWRFDRARTFPEWNTWAGEVVVHYWHLGSRQYFGQGFEPNVEQAFAQMADQVAAETGEHPVLMAYYVYARRVAEQVCVPDRVCLFGRCWDIPLIGGNCITEKPRK